MKRILFLMLFAFSFMGYSYGVQYSEKDDFVNVYVDNDVGLEMVAEVNLATLDLSVFSQTANVSVQKIHYEGSYSVAIFVKTMECEYLYVSKKIPDKQIAKSYIYKNINKKISLVLDVKNGSSGGLAA